MSQMCLGGLINVNLDMMPIEKSMVIGLLVKMLTPAVGLPTTLVVLLEGQFKLGTVRSSIGQVHLLAVFNQHP